MYDFNEDEVAMCAECGERPAETPYGFCAKCYGDTHRDKSDGDD